MAERKNPMQGVVDGLVGEYKNSKLAARTNGVIPLGQKQVSIDQASKEFAAMSPEQRQTTMNKICLLYTSPSPRD